MQVKDLKHHQSTEHIKASKLKEFKNKNERTLSNSELISDDLLEALSESFYFEEILYNQQVERILLKIQNHFKYINCSRNS